MLFIFITLVTITSYADHELDFKLNNTIIHKIKSDNPKYTLEIHFQRTKYFKDPLDAVYNAVGKGVGRYDNWPLKLKVTNKINNKYSIINISSIPKKLNDKIKELPAMNLNIELYWDTKHLIIKEISGQKYRNYKVYKIEDNNFLIPLGHAQGQKHLLAIKKV